MRALDKDYLIKCCTLLARLFTVLVLVNTLKFSTCLCWGYLMKNCKVLAKFSTCLVRGYLKKNCTHLVWPSYQPACAGLHVRELHAVGRVVHDKVDFPERR